MTKLFAVALDYDGTIAIDDTVDASVRDAIAALRTRGITVLLATGRILDDLRRVAGQLHFVDGVIAENGAVLHFPESGHTSPLAPPVPAVLLAELSRLGISFHAGRSLADAAARDAPQLLDVIRQLELPLVLIFNKGRVMVMPQGVSKGTGLHYALAADLRAIETQHRVSPSPDTVAKLADAVRSRYELLEEPLAVAAG